ncbi:MAG TPA: DUF6351 family protein [Burkholderiales bacterium]|nr:DUF6351 family protein [Burkholderiales bacterium]
MFFNGQRVSALVFSTCMALFYGSVYADDVEPEIKVLSNRADLISGGDALVEIVWGGAAHSNVTRIELNGVDVKSAFATRPNGRFMGLVTGLKEGDNLLTVRVGGAGRQITITNHPTGGPVFSGGRQLAPWICARTTVTPVTVTAPKDSTLVGTTNTRASGLSTNPFDDKCNTATDFLYYYQPKATEGTSCTLTITGTNPCFKPYPVVNDPATRPADADIADFTNDRGDTVKSLLRLEKGTINRSIYQVVAYFDPAKPWQPWAPQKGWNGKLMWKMGASTSSNRFEAAPSAGAVFDVNALKAGFIVANASSTEHSQNNNELLAAETLMMVKEHIIEAYGEIRYTMADGCSGGSMMQTTPATVMPGLLDGIQPTCSYPDAVSTWIETKDCGLLRADYFATPNGSLLSEAQRAAISGHPTSGYCNTWVTSFLPQFLPTNTNNCGAGFPASIVYDPALRRNGVRCDTDGSPQEAQWGTFVDADGNTKTKTPYDNIGVQYGLKALQSGVISAEEFVRLNEGVGSFDNDRNWSGGSTGSPIIPAPRHAAQTDVLPTIYKSGILVDGKRLARVAIIDLRAFDLNPNIHMPWRSFEERDRLDRANGTHANQVIRAFLTTNGGITPGAAGARQSFLMMDRWLANIEADTSTAPLEQKVINNKPADVTDACFNNAGATDADLLADVGLDNPACQVGAITKNMSSPRVVSGGPLAENVFKCQLKPLNFSDADYNGVIFNASQQARLMAVFPTGVCDWSLPGVGQAHAELTTFKNGAGGEPLGEAPVSSKISQGRGR